MYPLFGKNVANENFKAKPIEDWKTVMNANKHKKNTDSVDKISTSKKKDDFQALWISRTERLMIGFFININPNWETEKIFTPLEI